MRVLLAARERDLEEKEREIKRLKVENEELRSQSQAPSLLHSSESVDEIGQRQSPEAPTDPLIQDVEQLH
jgi:hypothetical protein